MSNWHTDLICECLELVEKGEIRFLFIEAPPRHSKSLHVSQLFPAWVMGRNKDSDIIVSSYSGDLATTHGRETRNLMDSTKYKNVFKTRLAQDSTAKGKFNTDGKGAYNAVGVGGSTTGKGAQIFVVDDSLKDRKEAESEVIRNGIWDWFRSVARTRLTPSGAMIVMQCMTGETPVLMADESQKPLKRIRVGDRIKTYKEGTLSESVVTKWSNQGSDNVLSVTLKSGRVLRANERHPFLVLKDDKPQWIKLKDLKKGDLIHVVRGQEFFVDERGVKIGQNAKASVTNATQRKDGSLERDQSQEQIGERDLNIDTESQKKISRGWPTSKTDFAQSVNKFLRKTKEVIGGVASASITTIKQKRLELFSVMIAIWQLDMERLQKSWKKQPNTSDFTLDEIIEIKPDGFEDVYDITVEGTENFIANGAVSHNTRWHLDDIIGKILEKDTWIDYFEYKKKGMQGRKWLRLRLPAFADTKEEYRNVGEPLWPQRYSHIELEDIKETLGPYEFSALYQQTPVQSGNQEFNPNWYKYINHQDMDQKYCPKRYLTIDTAVSQKDSADYTGFTDNRIDTNNFWHLKSWKQRITPDLLIEQLFALHTQNKYTLIGIEETTFTMAIKPFLEAEMRKRDIYLPIVPLKHNQTQKEIRIRALIPRYASGSIFHIEGENSELEFEQSVFPFGAHDDVLDSAAYQEQIVTMKGLGSFKQYKPKWSGTKSRPSSGAQTRRY